MVVEAVRSAPCAVGEAITGVSRYGMEVVLESGVPAVCAAVRRRLRGISASVAASAV